MLFHAIHVLGCRAVPGLMQNLALGRIRSFGGKLGQELLELGCTTAGEAQALPRALLEQRFGQQRAASISLAVRGISFEPVQVSELDCSLVWSCSVSPLSKKPCGVQRGRPIESKQRSALAAWGCCDACGAWRSVGFAVAVLQWSLGRSPGTFPTVSERACFALCRVPPGSSDEGSSLVPWIRLP
jgi:hypothetical protein